MEVLNLSEIDVLTEPCAVAIGNFDGVHLGHKYIIEQLKAKAEQNNLKPVIFCFEPQPKEYFQGVDSNFRITQLSDKIKILENLKIPQVIVANFNEEFSKITAEDFIEKIILKKINAKIIITGKEFIFGNSRAGNAELIKNIEQKNNKFKYFALDTKNNSCNKKISSTEVRDLINNGDILAANKLLGHNFSVFSEVLHGEKQGAQIGFRTANQGVLNYIQPKFGVYKTATFINKKKFNSISNFGIKPTAKNTQNKAFLETHILDFDEQIYGQKIEVEFLDYIRAEKKFNSLDELKSQINLDIKNSYN